MQKKVFWKSKRIRGPKCSKLDQNSIPVLKTEKKQVSFDKRKQHKVPEDLTPRK